MEPVNQVSESDTMVPGLCAFLLGVCYEFNREPGEITRYDTRSPIAALMSNIHSDQRYTRF